MFPSKKYPHYGVFVKNTVEILKKNNFDVDVIKLKKQRNKFTKITSYFVFYIKIIFSSLFFSYDFIYTHYASHTGLPLLFVKKMKKNLPIIVNVHGNDLIPEDSTDEKYWWIVKKIIDVSQYVICPSQYFKEEVMKRCKKKEEDIYVYPSGGVNTSLFHPINMSVAKKELGLDENKKYIGFISRIEVNKGWDIFLKSCKRILADNPEYRLFVVGDGSENNEYNKLVRELGIYERIDKLNFLPQENLVNAFNAMDIFVFPTRRKSESLGLVGLEAMACGTLVIASDKYGPSSYMINGVNGFTFDAEKSMCLYNVLNSIINSNQDFNQLRKNAIKTAFEYDVNNTGNLIVEILNKER